jgi:hypothetical protein
MSVVPGYLDIQQSGAAMKPAATENAYLEPTPLRGSSGSAVKATYTEPDTQEHSYVEPVVGFG